MRPTRQRLRDLSGWIIPLLYALAAVALGSGLPRLEQSFLPGLVATLSAPSAQAIYASIASGMIALTGIVFSLTFVMVQFSASAYSPRLALWVARDPVISHALGVFISTFLYALMMLAWVDRNATGKVPFITGWILFGLLLVSMGMFIALIQRIGHLRVSRMLIFTANQGRKAIEDLYPNFATAEIPPSLAPNRQKPPVIQTLVHTGYPQVVQAIRVEALVKLASSAGAVIEVAAAAGDTVLENTTLLRVLGTRQSLPEPALRGAIHLGDERTFEQDPRYAIRLVVDIAIKALSPAINDPTTAVQSLDQIEDLLVRVGRRCLDTGEFCDAAGEVRVVISYPGWEDYLRLGLDEIMFYGAESVQVMRRLKAVINSLRAGLPVPRHQALDQWEQRLDRAVNRTFPTRLEKQDASVPDRQGLGIEPAAVEDRTTARTSL